MSSTVYERQATCKHHDKPMIADSLTGNKSNGTSKFHQQNPSKDLARKLS